MLSTNINLYKTILGETGCLGNLYFIYWLPKHLVFLFTLILTQSVRLPMVTYPSLRSTCVTYGTPCHTRGHSHFHMWLAGRHATPEVTRTFNSLTCRLRDTMPRQRSLTLIPTEADDFSKGDNHFKHMPLPIYLAWL